MKFLEELTTDANVSYFFLVGALCVGSSLARRVWKYIKDRRENGKLTITKPRAGAFIGVFAFPALFYHMFKRLIVTCGYPLLPKYVHLFSFLCCNLSLANGARGKLSSGWFRYCVEIPAAWYSSTLISSFLFSKLLFGVEEVFIIGFCAVISGFGIWHSLTNKEEVVNIILDKKNISSLQRIPKPTTVPSGESLKIIQITDPHIGPFMPVHRLRNICERVVEKNPDFIFLTGDYYTVYAHYTKDCLKDALLPLAKVNKKTFACLGNHDYEVLPQVKQAFTDLGIRLLVDEEILEETKFGTLQILGSSFYFSQRETNIKKLMQQHPRNKDCIARIMLLHNPLDFKYIPDGDADLVLSGHLHGGQVGLAVLGFDWTVLSLGKLFRKIIPEHGLWGLGSNRLYAHRGTGFYGYPLRCGVVGEESVIKVHLVTNK